MFRNVCENLNNKKKNLGCQRLGASFGRLGASSVISMLGFRGLGAQVLETAA